MKHQRTLFQKAVADLNVTQFKFLDESSVNLSLTRLYGRAAPGQRGVDHVPLPSGPQTTTPAVIGLTGVSAPLMLSGAVNGTVFYGYIALQSDRVGLVESEGDVATTQGTHRAGLD